MLKRATAAILFSTALAAGPATAQSTGTSQPGSTAAPAATPAQPGVNANVRYITENRQDLWRASQLDGVNVYNESNEHIGDITEVLLNKQGQVEAVVIGVGGFLGIGQRDVAVPFNALQWQMTREGRVVAERGARTTGAATQGTQMGAQPVQPAPGPSATGTTRDSAARTSNVAPSDQMNDHPARAVLAGATKDQLSNAPQFRYAR